MNEHILFFQVALLLLLIALSAFFSGSETALFSLSRARLLAYKNETKLSLRLIVDLMENYHATLIVLILGNMFVNTGIAMTGDLVLSNLGLPPLLTTILSIFMAIFLLLIFGEVTPKALALKNAETVSSMVAIPIYFLRCLLTPFIWLLESLFSCFWKLVGRKENKPLNHEEYSSFIEIAHSVGAFSDEETNLLSKAFDLRKTLVSKIMIGRTDIDAVKIGMDSDEVAKLLREKKDAYLPIINEDLDDSESVLSSKSFFMLEKEDRHTWWESQCVNSVIFVPENTTLTKALATLRTKNLSVALAVDEYGGVVGLLDLENIYEELIGEIEDEHETPEWEVRRIDQNTWRFNGSMALEDVGKVLSWQVPEDFSAKTLSGLFPEILARLPHSNDVIKVNNMSFKALILDKHRVELVEISKVQL